MSYFKKFCDLIGGIGAFFASIFLFGQYMDYEPQNLTETDSKLKLFFSAEGTKEYRQYFIFIALLFAAVLLGRVLKKLPCVSLPLSILPLCQIMGMLWCDIIYANADFYVMVSVVVVVGNIYELCSCDDDGGKQILIGSSVVGSMGVVLAFLSARFSSIANDMNERSMETDLTEADTLLKERLFPFGVNLFSDLPEAEEGALIFIALTLALAVLLSLLWKDVGLPFFDLVFAAVPLVGVIIDLHGEKLDTSPMLVIVPVVVYFFVRVALFVKRDR